MIYIHVTGVLCIFIFSSGNSNPPNYFLGEKNIVFGVASLWPLDFIFAACPSSVLKWERTGDFKTGGEPNPFYNTSSTLLHQTTSRYTLIPFTKKKKKKIYSYPQSHLLLSVLQLLSFVSHNNTRFITSLASTTAQVSFHKSSYQLIQI